MHHRKVTKNILKDYSVKLIIILFWLLLWEAASRALGHSILLPAPSAVLATLAKLMINLDFWQTILFSSLRIIIGFLLALLAGIILAVGAHNSRMVEALIAPIMKTIQAMPVASFIILALIWIKAKNLSVLASFMMVMPLIYSNVAQGLKAADSKLLNMAKVFQIGKAKTIKAIYIPAVIPYFISAVSVGVGLCWKAGIAAEVIGIPTGSIGERLYEAKLYLMTEDLFAWTIVIIMISILFEKFVLLLIRRLQKDAARQRKTAEE
jgi:ABC-type nitrate/sulfonate/bicarbonate transport system, permease component